MHYAVIIITLFLHVAHLCGAAEESPSVILFNNSGNELLLPAVSVVSHGSESASTIMCAPYSSHEIFTTRECCVVQIKVQEMTFKYTKERGEAALFIMLTPITESDILPIVFCGQKSDIPGLQESLKKITSEIFIATFASGLLSSIKHFVAWLEALKKSPTTYLSSDEVFDASAASTHTVAGHVAISVHPAAGRAAVVPISGELDDAVARLHDSRAAAVAAQEGNSRQPKDEDSWLAAGLRFLGIN